MKREDVNDVQIPFHSEEDVLISLLHTPINETRSSRSLTFQRLNREFDSFGAKKKKKSLFYEGEVISLWRELCRLSKKETFLPKFSKCIVISSSVAQKQERTEL